MRRKFFVPGLLAVIVSGCAGSASHEIVAAHQATDESLTCVQLTAEITRAQVVIDGVNKDKDDLTAADVMDGLLWFPFNLIAKDGNYKDAIEAADGRIDRLNDLKKEKNCSTVVENKLDTSDIVEKISKLNALYKSGAIDEGEYKALKQQLLSGITSAGPVASVGSAGGAKAKVLPVVARAPSPSAKPVLPPAQYTALPVGTRVDYDTWSYVVEKSTGSDITIKIDEKRWAHLYGVFGKSGDGVYTGFDSGRHGGSWSSSLTSSAKSALEKLWPLKPGKKARLKVEEERSGYSGFPDGRPWDITFEVVGTEYLVLGGVRYATFVIREHTTSDGVISNYAGDAPLAYAATYWYHPGSGLVLKVARKWTKGSSPGSEVEYKLVRVRYPAGTAHLALSAAQ